MEPIVIDDVPSSMTDEGMNPQFENSFNLVIPIIEDAETPAETLAETWVETRIEIHDETSIETLVDTSAKSQPT